MAALVDKDDVCNIKVPSEAMKRTGLVEMQLVLHENGELLHGPVISFMALRSLKKTDQETDEPVTLLVALVDQAGKAIYSIENMQVQAVEAETPSAKLETVDGAKLLTLGLVRGKPGEPGVSPVVTVDAIDGGHRVSITDVSGTQSFDVMDGADISDEQIAAAVEAYLKDNPIEGGVDEEQLQQAVENALQAAKDSGKLPFPITPQMYGAKANGVDDDTEAVLAAIEAGDYVFFPEGSYVISSPVYVGQGKTLYGTGVNSVLICKSSAEFIMLNAETTFRDLYIQMKSEGYNGNAITVNEKSLATANLSSGNVGITIDNIIITWHDYVYTQCANIEISLSGAFNDRQGFWGVSVNNVRANGNSTSRDVGYFLRSYCAAEKAWITGCQIVNCTAENCRWGIFLHTTDDDFTDAYANTATTHGIDKLSVIRYQHQCNSKTKGFVYFRKGMAAQLTDCIPWDWHYAVGEYKNYPYCMDYERFTTAAGEDDRIDIVPQPIVDSYMAIRSDGTFVPSDYYHLYEASKNIGTQYVDLDLMPKQFQLKNHIYGACIYHTTKLDRIFADNTYYGVHFQLFDGDQVLKNISVVLHTATPYIVTNRPLNSRTKFGYVKTDTDFKLYIYSERSYDFTYSYLINSPIANTTTSYSGTGSQMEYNKTINTFGWAESEKFLTALPDGLVQITTVQCLSDNDKNNVMQQIQTEVEKSVETALAEAKASGEFDGADGESVTVKSVSESSVDGGNNVVTFSDGKTVTIKNGTKGSPGEPGYTPVKGKDYFDGKKGDPFTYDDFTEEQLAALKGKDGDPGASGVYLGSTEPTDPRVYVWIDPDGEPSGYEEWVFTLADGSTVTKRVVVLA